MDAKASEWSVMIEAVSSSCERDDQCATKKMTGWCMARVRIARVARLSCKFGFRCPTPHLSCEGGYAESSPAEHTVCASTLAIDHTLPPRYCAFPGKGALHPQPRSLNRSQHENSKTEAL